MFIYYAKDFFGAKTTKNVRNYRKIVENVPRTQEMLFITWKSAKMWSKHKKCPKLEEKNKKISFCWTKISFLVEKMS